MIERESFNVRRREARFAGVGQEGRKTFEENDKVSGREMVIENEGKRVQVRERKAEFEESASDDEEGVASIGEGSSVGRNMAREG